MKFLFLAFFVRSSAHFFFPMIVGKNIFLLFSSLICLFIHDILIAATLRNFLLFFSFIGYILSVSPPESPIPFPHSTSMRGASPPTHSLLPGIHLHWGIKPPQDQAPLLPLMSNKAILCHIHCKSHESFYVYSLVGGPVPASFSIWIVDTVAPPTHGAVGPLSSFIPFSNSSPGDPVLSPKVGWEHLGICLCICEALLEHFRIHHIRLLSARTSQHPK